ncbi:lysophospholipid acyltransferase family protein [Desulfobacter vibrioformis]|uniref:lysophospholipid acyltransferase family protein n=1 Tax=Desulfobacter vibrioformis TaxID=34031 RepID=UPI000550EC36|nr:lysophospholipid acyltransferase family protein [Desulfobacter vibrioformis]
MNALFKIAYQPYKWMIVIPAMFLNTLVIALICIVVGAVFNPDKADALAVIWARIFCAIAPIRVRIQGRQNYNPKASYVVVANHKSMVDIPVLHGFTGLTIKWVMKTELQKIPVFGTACTFLGCIYVDRSNGKSAVESIDAAKNRLSDKASIVFFAEGTRSRGKLLPFKKGAFVFAMTSGLPVLPVTIKNSEHILPSDTLDLMPGTVDLIIHPPVHIPNCSKAELNEKIDQIHQTVAGAL